MNEKPIADTGAEAQEPSADVDPTASASRPTENAPTGDSTGAGSDHETAASSADSSSEPDSESPDPPDPNTALATEDHLGEGNPDVHEIRIRMNVRTGHAAVTQDFDTASGVIAALANAVLMFAGQTAAAEMEANRFRQAFETMQKAQGGERKIMTVAEAAAHGIKIDPKPKVH